MHPHGEQITLCHMRQDDVLGVRHPAFIETVIFGQTCHYVHLRRTRIAGDAAVGFEADIDDRITRLLVRLDVLIEPGMEGGF